MQTSELQRLIDELKIGVRSHIYILLGIHDHYVLTKVAVDSIEYYDSLNLPLTDVWNGTDHSLTEE